MLLLHTVRKTMISACACSLNLFGTQTKSARLNEALAIKSFRGEKVWPKTSWKNGGSVPHGWSKKAGELLAAIKWLKERNFIYGLFYGCTAQHSHFLASSSVEGMLPFWLVHLSSSLSDVQFSFNKFYYRKKSICSHFCCTRSHPSIPYCLSPLHSMPVEWWKIYSLNVFFSLVSRHKQKRAPLTLFKKGREKKMQR